MANIRDFFAYLNDNITIAPANSEEEVQASHFIENIFKQHGLETTVQDFSASAGGDFAEGGLYVLTFIGVVLAGTQVSPLTPIGFVITLVSAALLLARFLGNDIVRGIDTSTHSQNVIGIHRASVDEGERANRPIIVVAHYDTPRENLLYREPFAGFSSIMLQALPILLLVVTILSFIQILGFIPSIARRVVWSFGIIGALPIAFVGASQVSTRFMPCTEGANDNKSGVAAMLTVMNHVCPQTKEDASEEDQGHESHTRDLAADQESSSDNTTSDVTDADRTAPFGRTQPIGETVEMEAVEGIRHGAEVLNGLGILPASCTVTYIEPKVTRRAPVRKSSVDPSSTKDMTADEVQDTQSVQQTQDTQSIPDTQAITDEQPQNTQNMKDSRDSRDAVARQDISVQAIPITTDGADTQAERAEGTTENKQESNKSQESKEKTEPFSDVSAIQSEAPTNNSRRSVLERLPNTVNNTSSARARRPVRTAAQKAALIDLADPSKDSIDPLDAPGDLPDFQPLELRSTPLVNPNRSSQQAVEILTQQAVGTQQGMSAQEGVSTQGVMGAQRAVNTQNSDQQKRKRRGLFNRRKRQEEQSMSEWLGVDEDYNAQSQGREIGSWENFNTQDESESTWKGGAALSSRFRVIEGSSPTADEAASTTSDSKTKNDSETTSSAAKEATNEVELREVSLSLGDDDLISHDIYFVALGGSGCGHAGMKAFLDTYRRDCRGAFLFNLSCVGAGSLTILTEEGLDNRRKADRRLVRLIRDTAQDIHLELDEGTMRWGDTDATPAMRTSMRAATIIGFDEKKMPALSHTNKDTEESIDTKQINEVASLVLETIRRS